VPAGSALRRPVVAVPLAAVFVALVSIAGWQAYKANRASWARNQALPEIAKLAGDRKYSEAAALAERAERYLPGDPALAALWTDIAVAVSVESNPEGAAVEIRRYDDATAPWRSLGVTPIRGTRLPRGVYRWRFTKAGSVTVEGAAPAVSVAPVRVEMPAAGSVPDGFVQIPKGNDVIMLAGMGLPEEFDLDAYLMQRYEVTNRDYKKFVDAGGYRRRELWKHPFVDNGRTLTWDEGMSRLRDKVGQPGPATWEVGAYPAGQDDVPVGGVSWYEAAAYAEFAGLALPTVAHWYRAAGMTSGAFLIPAANFDHRGPRAVSASHAMSPSGVFDMAGNVKEWVWNADDVGGRYLLGGGWGEPTYMFGNYEPRSAFDRTPTNGFRCVKYPGDGQPDARSARPRARPDRNYTKKEPVTDAMFAQFLRLQQYAPRPLDAKLEKTIDGDPATRVERASFTAAYDGDRVIAYLWLPKTVKPPYQTLVVFPGAEMLQPQSSAVLEQPSRYDFLVRSGRAVVYPMYYGTYERHQPISQNSLARRDATLRWIQDLRRTLDYLETRGDIDRSKIGYFGLSLGGGLSPTVLAGEPRLKVAALMGAGLVSIPFEPEVEPVNFLPRVRQPVLVVNGRYDYFIPLDPAQAVFFKLLGSPDKTHEIVDAPHSVPRTLYLPLVLGFLDKHFGPAR
jgi:formylglycine-generating enzyme required for sulfatase activity/dienelactone hydrolase